MLPNGVSLLLAFLSRLIMSSPYLGADCLVNHLSVTGSEHHCSFMAYLVAHDSDTFLLDSVSRGRKTGRRSRWIALSTDTSVRPSGAGAVSSVSLPALADGHSWVVLSPAKSGGSDCFVNS